MWSRTARVWYSLWRPCAVACVWLRRTPFQNGIIIMQIRLHPTRSKWVSHLYLWPMKWILVERRRREKQIQNKKTNGRKSKVRRREMKNSRLFLRRNVGGWPFHSYETHVRKEGARDWETENNDSSVFKNTHRDMCECGSRCVKNVCNFNKKC